MTTAIGFITSLFTAALGWCGQIVTFVTGEGHEIILLFILLPLIGLGIGFFKRLLHA